MQEENGSGTGSTPAPAAAADGTRRAAPNDKAAPRHRAEGDARAISSLWRRGKRWGKGAFSVTTALSTLLLAGWIVWLVGEATLRSRGLNLHLIAVPEKLAKDGVTTEVLTWRMRDAIMAVQDLGATTMAKTNVQVRQNMTDITIPMAGVSVESVVASIRHLLPASWRHEAYGEFTLTGTRLSLRLRLNGPIVFSDAATYPDALDTLIEKAAFKLVEETQPYVAASARFEKGDLDGAAAAADQIIASFPPEDESFMRAYNLKGLVAQQQGDVRKAAAFYMMAPNLAVARLNLGVLLDKSGNVEEAAAEYGKAILLDPKYAPPHNNLGRLWWKQKKPDRAIAEFLTAIRLDPKYALPHYNLGVLRDEQNEPDNAVAEYRAAIRLDPKDAPPHNKLGDIWYQQNKPDDAITEYRTAIRLDPNFASPHNGLGNVWYDWNRPDDAIAEYRAAIRLDPNFASPHNGLGNIWRDQNKPDDAIAEYREAIVLDPKSALPHNTLGNVWYDQKKPDDAIAEYRTAIRLDPKSALPHNNLGNVWYDQKKPDDAIAEYREAIRLDSNFASPHNGLGNIWHDRNKLDDAIAEFREAIRLDPTQAAPYYNLGIATRDLARPATDQQQKVRGLKDACTAYRQGAKLAANDAAFRERMGEIDALLQGEGHCPPAQAQ